jgi:hypothetical protein
MPNLDKVDAYMLLSKALCNGMRSDAQVISQLIAHSSAKEFGTLQYSKTIPLRREDMKKLKIIERTLAKNTY